VKTKLVIFGVTGDLSRRKLLPALTSILTTAEGQDLEIVGVSRREVDRTELLQEAQATVLSSKLSVFTMDLARPTDYLRLKDYLHLSENDQALIYLSVPPSAAYQIVELLGEAGLNTANVKLLLEKPFGVDLVSAREMTERIGRFFDEGQLYRIDHYLAKEMAQNIVAFRGGNAVFSHLWDKRAIEKIEVVASERIDIEGRAGFYEQTGALRDFVQGHLMQLLSLVLIDIPSALDWTELPRLRREAIEALLPADPQKAIRAQYEGYQKEVDNPGSRTETFVAVELASRDPRWEGVPLHLVTGKALDKKTTEIRVYFKKFHTAQRNRLIFHIQPDEGVEIELFTKKPGYERAFETHKLSFTYPEDTVLPDAYEQVLVDAIRSQKSLFTSSEEVIASWRVLEPVLEAWSMDDTPLQYYPKGSSTHTICSVE